MLEKGSGSDPSIFIPELEMAFAGGSGWLLSAGILYLYAFEIKPITIVPEACLLLMCPLWHYGSNVEMNIMQSEIALRVLYAASSSRDVP